MQYWKVQSGLAKIDAKSLRPNVFGARLYIFHPASKSVEEIAPDQPDSDTFTLSAKQVDALISGPDFLFMTTRHVLSQGVADLKWGWRYRLTQDSGNPTCLNADMSPANVDHAGYWNSELKLFGEVVELDRIAIDLVN